MAYQQSDINNIVNGVLGYSGQRIAFPDGRYLGECTAPIVWYLTNMGAPIPAMADDRADGWGVSFPTELASFFTHEVFQPGKSYPYGTVLMWNSPHIAIVLHSDSSNYVQVFEQNADPNGASCQIFNREVNNVYHTCTYALVPIVENIFPAIPIFTITQEFPNGRNIRMNADHPRYQIDINPVVPMGMQHQGDPIIAIKVATHVNGQEYFMAADSDTTGWNSQDVEDYDPTPTAAPLPTGALTVPVLTSQYELIVPVKAYISSTDAKNGTKAVPALLEPGSYIQYPTPETDMIYLSLPTGVKYWINPADNAVPAPVTPPPVVDAGWTPPRSAPLPTPTHPAPPNWKSTYKSFRDIFGEVQPIAYKFLVDYDIVEADKGKIIHMNRGDVIEMGGIVWKDSKEYLRPAGAAQAFTWYLIEDNGQVCLPHDPLHQSENYLETEFQPIIHALSSAEKWFHGTIKLKSIGKSIMDIKRRK